VIDWNKFPELSSQVGKRGRGNIKLHGERGRGTCSCIGSDRLARVVLGWGQQCESLRLLGYLGKG
jgi:hypothetical protein